MEREHDIPEPRETLAPDSPEKVYARMEAALHERAATFGQEDGVVSEWDEKREKHGELLREKERIWSRLVFDTIPALEKTRGPFIEVAGPTEGGYFLVRGDELPKPLLSSNINPTSKLMRKDGSIWEEKVDFQADARKLPIADASVGAVFCSALGRYKTKEERGITPKDHVLRGQTLEEAWRVLEEGGILVWQGGRLIDGTYAESLGFQLMEYYHTLYEAHSHVREVNKSQGYEDTQFEESWHYIFQKPRTVSTDNIPRPTRKMSRFAEQLGKRFLRLFPKNAQH